MSSVREDLCKCRGNVNIYFGISLKEETESWTEISKKRNHSPWDKSWNTRMLFKTMKATICCCWRGRHINQRNQQEMPLQHSFSCLCMCVPVPRACGGQSTASGSSASLHCRPRTWTQAVRLLCKPSYPLSPLTPPSTRNFSNKILVDTRT